MAAFHLGLFEWHTETANGTWPSLLLLLHLCFWTSQNVCWENGLSASLKAEVKNPFYTSNQTGRIKPNKEDKQLDAFFICPRTTPRSGAEDKHSLLNQCWAVEHCRTLKDTKGHWLLYCTLIKSNCENLIWRTQIKFKRLPLLLSHNLTNARNAALEMIQIKVWP